ncbi:MAG: NADH:flavin oxidoreductase [Chloroflexi bacterium]|nr:NADH:flavin oxidoreductase [Chloroflexota bacterium]
MSRPLDRHVHTQFRYRSLDDLQHAAQALGLELPTPGPSESLAEPLATTLHVIPNRFALQPMEGCDGTMAGAPGALTVRRYERFARGGAGLIWFEATAVLPKGRANPRQLMLDDTTAPAFNDLVHITRREASQRPYLMLQLTHSGRYSQPSVIAHRDGVLDARHNLPSDYPLIGDAELAAMPEAFVRAARLAQQAGFDAVDIKACHRYLFNELLAAHTRPGVYGGDYANRSRILLETCQAVLRECPGLEVWVRLNAYDGHPYPWGWGIEADDPSKPDLCEPLRLVEQLAALGVTGINVTAGNPYFTPHINRPYDQTLRGASLPEEHPLVGVVRLLHLTRALKQHAGRMLVMGSGYSWLRQHCVPIGAGAVADGWTDLIGLGRLALAYPDLPADVLAGHGADVRKCCTACSRCSQMMRNHTESGCAVFDRKIYRPIYEAGFEH